MWVNKSKDSLADGRLAGWLAGSRLHDHLLAAHSFAFVKDSLSSQGPARRNDEHLTILFLFFCAVLWRVPIRRRSISRYDRGDPLGFFVAVSLSLCQSALDGPTHETPPTTEKPDSRAASRCASTRCIIHAAWGITGNLITSLSDYAAVVCGGGRRAVGAVERQANTTYRPFS